MADSYNFSAGSVAMILLLHVYVTIAIGYHLYNYVAYNGNVCALAIMKSSRSFNLKNFSPVRANIFFGRGFNFEIMILYE